MAHKTSTATSTSTTEVDSTAARAVAHHSPASRWRHCSLCPETVWRPASISPKCTRQTSTRHWQLWSDGNLSIPVPSIWLAAFPYWNDSMTDLRPNAKDQSRPTVFVNREMSNELFKSYLINTFVWILVGWFVKIQKQNINEKNSLDKNFTFMHDCELTRTLRAAMSRCTNFFDSK